MSDHHEQQPICKVLFIGFTCVASSWLLWRYTWCGRASLHGMHGMRRWPVSEWLEWCWRDLQKILLAFVFIYSSCLPNAMKVKERKTKFPDKTKVRVPNVTPASYHCVYIITTKLQIRTALLFQTQRQRKDVSFFFKK